MFPFPGVIPPKILLYGGLALGLILTHTGAYFYGKAVQRAETEKDKVEVVLKELEKEQLEGQKFAKRAEQTGREVAEMEAAVDAALERLNRAIDEARNDPNRVGCDLTNDELDGLQAIYDSYR